MFLDVRVKRGVDINSDHHLLVGEFRMKLAAKKKTDNKVQRKFEIRKLQNTKMRQELGISLLNRFQALDEGKTLMKSGQTTQSLNNKLQVFTNSHLRHILKVWWPNKISNKELWLKIKQEEISTTVMRRKWNWIDHTPRKDPTNTTKQALDYNPQGKRRQGRSKVNWRRSTLQDLDKVQVTWQEAEALAQKRLRWRNMVDALCS